jgi:DNA-binding NarL/FixJ family response regulator
MGAIRIAVAGRETLYRQAIIELLRSEPGIEVIGEAADTRAACGVCVREAPDILVIEGILAMEYDGPSPLDTLRACSPSTLLVVIGAVEESALAEHGRRDAVRRTAGIMVVPPVTDRRELVRLLRTAIGSRPTANSDERAPVPRSRRDLTERERDVLALIAEGRCNKEIALGLGISTQTVKNHVSHLLEKLTLEDRTQLAVYAIETHEAENRLADPTGPRE